MALEALKAVMPAAAALVVVEHKMVVVVVDFQAVTQLVEAVVLMGIPTLAMMAALVVVLDQLIHLL